MLSGFSEPGSLPESQLHRQCAQVATRSPRRSSFVGFGPFQREEEGTGARIRITVACDARSVRIFACGERVLLWKCRKRAVIFMV